MGSSSTSRIPAGRRHNVAKGDKVMADNFTICVGTVGTGAWVSGDGGESWRGLRAGLWSERPIFGLAVQPNHPRTILAGAADGVALSEDGGVHFAQLDSPSNAAHAWN